MIAQARYDHWIDGCWVPPAAGSHRSTTDPTVGQPGPQVAAGSAPDVEAAVIAAKAAHPAWAARPAAERADILLEVARGMEAADDELLELERVNTGKVASQLRTEIDTSVAYVRYYAGVLRGLHGRTIDPGAGAHAYTRLEPYGVVGIITTCRSTRPVAPWRRPWRSATPWCASPPRSRRCPRCAWHGSRQRPDCPMGS